jgi:hypothetical protein
MAGALSPRSHTGAETACPPLAPGQRSAAAIVTRPARVAQTAEQRTRNAVAPAVHLR